MRFCEGLHPNDYENEISFQSHQRGATSYQNGIPNRCLNFGLVERGNLGLCTAVVCSNGHAIFRKRQIA